MESYITEKLRLKDDKLDIDHLGDYTLNLHLSDYEFAFSVYNSSDNRCLRLESFVFPSKLVFGKNDDLLLKIFEDNHLLPAAFWKEINLFICNTNYTFIPSELFSSENTDLYLEFNCSTSSVITTSYYERFDDVVLVYGINKGVHDFMKKIYPSRNVSTKSYLSNILPVALSERSKSDKNVFTFLDQGLVTVLVNKNGKFHYCNTSHFKTLDDALYYIMMVYNEINLDPETVPLKIYGNSDSLVLLQSRIFKFIRHVELGTRPQGLKLCYEFDALEEGRFYGLLNASI